ncbi:MAG TPA: 5'-methylthioadenosine/S-adenosylhomocysteine nucleosidase [Kofleriaceae bacterium]|nr:5'-methylthioadenosine/S-adenosylhomocysteine nucleosidase [Kofleriaceae bacterium]
MDPSLRGRVAIVAPCRLEAERLRARLHVEEARRHLGRPQWLGALGGLPVVVTECGISMVNAAIATQALLDRAQVEAVVVAGVAGGVAPALGPGDVVVPASWASYQESHLARRAGDGWACDWSLMDFTNFGMMFPRPVFVARAAVEDGQGGDGDDDDGDEVRFWFEVDPGLLAAARRAAGAGSCRVVLGGRGVSGAPFVDNLEFRDWLGQCFRAEVLDQETAAVAQTAHVNGVPFIAFRAVSDLAGGDEGANPIEAQAGGAADLAAAAIEAFCRELARAREAAA